MAPPWRFLNFLLEPKKMSSKWPKSALLLSSANGQYLGSEMEIQKSPRWRHSYTPDILPAKK